VTLRYAHAHPFWRRAHRWLRDRMQPDALRKPHRVHLVQVGPRMLKQVSFEHASEARRVEANLRALHHLGRVPRVVFRRQARLWVEFVEGRPLDPQRDDDVRGLIRFFADLYQAARRVEPAAIPVHAQLIEDIQFLRSVGMLADASAAALGRAAEQCKPERIWLGLDYVDALRKNFIVTAQGPVAIDIEALQPDQPLGVGIAKARARWWRIDEQALLHGLLDAGAPDLRAQLPYARLAFAVAYAKQNIFRGKARRIRQADFEALLAELGMSSAATLAVT